MPGIRGRWSEGAFYGFDEIDAEKLATGAEFRLVDITDQFAPPGSTRSNWRPPIANRSSPCSRPSAPTRRSRRRRRISPTGRAC
jgi:hypothetical protein